VRSIRLLAAAFIVSGFSAATQANAQARITETTRYYKVNGKTGMELLLDMNRKGPRHGFLTKAIAQTQFKTRFLGDIYYSNGYCSTRNGGYSVAITYVYPQPEKPLSGVLAKRWRAFQATNVAHEREHGRIARKMANAVARKIRGFKVADKPGCRKSTAALGREIDALIDAQNAEQAAFDKREHREHGPVEKSILALVRK